MTVSTNNWCAPWTVPSEIAPQGNRGVIVDRLTVDPPTAARRLLGATLHGRGVSAFVVEVEAYGGVPDGPWPDAASHSFRGPTARNAVMIGPPGRLYTYRSHGIHVCANVVTGEDGVASAVLLRAAVVSAGTQQARVRRGPGVRDVALARGPGNLCSALGITMADNGINLLDPASDVRIELGEVNPLRCGPRVGVSAAADRPWRFWLPDRPEVSAYRRSPRAPQFGLSD
jgi:DNA-3-methyladenine glycosylase